MIQKQKSKNQLEDLIHDLDMDKLEKLLKTAKKFENDITNEILTRLTSVSKGRKYNWCFLNDFHSE